MSKLITAAQLDRIHVLQGRALDNRDHATYWALSLAVDFALGIPQAVDEDIDRVERNQWRKP